jgi:hypothetical protein
LRDKSMPGLRVRRNARRCSALRLLTGSISSRICDRVSARLSCPVAAGEVPKTAVARVRSGDPSKPAKPALGSEQGPATGRRVTVVDIPDGRLAIPCYRTVGLAYRTFDKVRQSGRLRSWRTNRSVPRLSSSARSSGVASVRVAVDRADDQHDPRLKYACCRIRPALPATHHRIGARSQPLSMIPACEDWSSCRRVRAHRRAGSLLGCG